MMAFKPKKEKKFDPLAEFRKRPALDSDGKVSTHKTVFDQEETAAALVGGKRHRGSGAKDFHKSDASSERYQIEAKQTAHKQIALKLEWLSKISYEAFGVGKTPMLHIRFLDTDPSVDQDWVMVPQREFKRLLSGE